MPRLARPNSRATFRGHGPTCRRRSRFPGRSASPSSSASRGFYALPTPAAQYFSIGVGGLGAALALQGLAVAHALSRGLKMRPFMLVALYACCVLRAKYTLPVLAALGVVDGFLKLRSRAALIRLPCPDWTKKEIIRWTSFYSSA